MSDFKLTQINNIMLGTTDLPRSVAFYHGTLGLDMQFETPGFAFLNGGGVTLALSKAHARLATPVAGGTEVVFCVADVTTAHEALVARGVEFLNAPRNVRPVIGGPLTSATRTGTCCRSSVPRKCRLADRGLAEDGTRVLALTSCESHGLQPGTPRPVARVRPLE